MKGELKMQLKQKVECDERKLKMQLKGKNKREKRGAKIWTMGVAIGSLASDKNASNFSRLREV